MKKQLSTIILANILIIGIFSCQTEEGEKDSSQDKQYIIAAAAGDANYLLQTQSIDSGNVTVKNNGYETSIGTAWIFYKNKYLYRLQYNDGNAGITTSYSLSENGNIEQRPNEYNITRFTTYGIFGENIITASAVETDVVDSEGHKAKGVGIVYLHTQNETTSTTTIAGENFLGNGEFVTFAGILESSNKLYTSVVPLGLSKYGVNTEGGKWIIDPSKIAQEDGGSGSGAYVQGEIPGTQYPDSAWVAIYDNNQFQNPIIAKTNKVGYATGRRKSQYYQTIWADDNGNVYLFSPGYGRYTSHKYQTKGTLPSGVIRIKNGETDFDKEYYQNIETLSGGQPIYRCWHITQDYFLLQMYTQGLNSQGTGTTKMAIYKGEEKTFNYVNGLPSSDIIASFGNTPYCENGNAYIAVVTTDGNHPSLYKISPATATASKALSITADEVSAIGKLEL